MFSPSVLEMFKELIDHDIEVSLHKREDGVYYADLHTQAKSHLHVSEQAGKVVFDMRYGEQEVLDVTDGAEAILYHAAACYAYHCICGRNYGSRQWDRVCKDFGITVSYGNL